MTHHPYPTAPKKKSKALPILLGLGLGALLLCGVLVVIAAVSGSPDPATDPANTSAGPGTAVGEATGTAATRAAEKLKPTKAVPVGVTEGSWEVPGEVKPGTYTTTADGHCYWARLKAFDGELTSINANGNLDPGQRGRLTVKASDKGLELQGDCVWTRAK